VGGEVRGVVEEGLRADGVGLRVEDPSEVERTELLAIAHAGAL